MGTNTLPTGFIRSFSLLAALFSVSSHAGLARRALTTPETLPGAWQYQGCYTDVGRTLGAAGYVDDIGMTDESCITFCAAKGFQYAGTEYFQECFCDSAPNPAAVQVADIECNSPCKGNASQACGAGGKLTMFHSPEPVGPQPNPGVDGYNHIGCYTEGTTGRALTHVIGTITAANMATALCIGACKTAGYSMAGVEFGGECFCDNSVKNGGLLAQSGCNMLCNGNQTEICGGPGRLNVYQLGGVLASSTSTTAAATTSTTATGTDTITGTASTTSASATPTGPSQPATVGNWNFYGCRTEGTNMRALSQKDFAADTMTLEICSAICTGYKYFGVEYSRECYCGNFFNAGSIPAPEAQCDMLCMGNNLEYCGAGNRLSVYTVGSVSSSGTTTGTDATTGTATGTTAPTPTGPTQPEAVGNYGFYGCQTEGTNMRALSAKDYAADTMTLQLCATFCAGYTYFGVEYARECYCGNFFNPGSVAAASTQCDMVCMGDHFEYCGAGNRLSVYSLNAVSSSGTLTGTGTSTGTNTATGTSSPTPTGPSQPLTVSDSWDWYGCQTEATNMRALSSKGYASGTMTLESCAAFCSGYTYFGVEYAGECYCGNSFNAGSVPALSTECDFLCSGNPLEYCGAGNRLSVYKKLVSSSSTTGTATTATTTTSVVPSNMPTGWSSQGCWIDGAQGRILSHQEPDSETNTPAQCATTCANLGYSISGTEYSVQCFCGNELVNGAAKTLDEQCNADCSGDVSQKCGGGDRITMYSIGAPNVHLPPTAQLSGFNGSWIYAGCFEDNVNDKRTFYWQLLFPGIMTPGMCLDKCSSFGYAAAGLEYGEECYCGDPANIITAGLTARPEIECDIVCKGNSSAICGGGSRLSSYFWTGDPLYSWSFPQDPAQAGKYEFLIGGVTVPLMTMQSITGKVSFLSKWGTGPGNETGAYELDLTEIGNWTAAWRTLHLKTDVFCSAGVILPDKAGRQLNVGGWAGDATFGTRLYWPDGSDGVFGTHDWEENVNELSLQVGRWYPTSMILANGSVMVIGGEVGANAAAVPSIEILPKTGTPPVYMEWLERTNPNNLYPFVCVLPKSGNVFVAYWNEARILNPNAEFVTVKTLPNIPGAVNDDTGGRTYPLEGTAVLLPQHAPYTADLEILICGGSTVGVSNALDNCVSTFPEADSPEWKIERMPSPRVLPCIAPLPDGTYLIANGAHHGVAGFGLASGPNLNALLYDPTKPYGHRITVMANTTIARLYHSEAITLLDGRVLISGSDPEDGVNPEEYRVEVFVPPYLLKGLPRPSFSIANKDWAYGQAGIPFTLGTAAVNGPVKVSLLGAVSSTHGNSMGSRTLFPSFNCAGTSCTVDAPPSASVAPPGWYQMHVLDGGVPALATYVRIGGDPAQFGNWPPGADFSKPGM